MRKPPPPAEIRSRILGRIRLSMMGPRTSPSSKQSPVSAVGALTSRVMALPPKMAWGPRTKDLCDLVRRATPSAIARRALSPGPIGILAPRPAAERPGSSTCRFRASGVRVADDLVDAGPVESFVTLVALEDFQVGPDRAGAAEAVGLVSGKRL